jgi:hypothetical protein
MSRTVVRDIGWSHVKADAMQMDGLLIEAGLFENAGEHDGTPLAQIGFWQEFGTKNIPARAWLSEGAAYVERAALKDIEKIVNQMGRFPKDPKLMLVPLAKAVAEGIRTYAINNHWTPNAASTIKQKGFDWPLVQTGAMIDAIDGRVKRYGRARQRI